MKKSFLLLSWICLMLSGILVAQDTLSRKETNKQQANFLLSGRPWTIEIPLWIPGYAGNFAYGEIGLEGEDGVDPENPIESPGGILSRLFTDEWYLKFFFMSRVAYENNRFIAQIDALTGSVGESVKFNYNDQEIVQVSYSTINIRLFGGYRFIDAFSKDEKFRYELYGYLGVRMHFNKIYSELGGSTTILDISPSWVEPITGLLNQFTWKRWFVVVQGDFGGYFINSKYSSQLSGYVYYKCGKLTSVKFGWNHFALNQVGTFRNEDYQIKATFSGPMVGVVFHF